MRYNLRLNTSTVSSVLFTALKGACSLVAWNPSS